MTLFLVWGCFLYFPQPLWSSPAYFFFFVARPCKMFPCVFIIADLVELLDRLPSVWLLYFDRCSDF